MDFKDKRDREILTQLINIKKRTIQNIDDLLLSDNLTCSIDGYNTMTFYKPSSYSSYNKELIIKLLMSDKERLFNELKELESKIK